MKKIISFFTKPNVITLIISFILTIIFCSTAIVFAVINKNNIVLEILSYVIYAFAAITLSYSIYTIVKYSSKIKRGVINLIKKTNFGKKLLEQYSFRTIIFSIATTFINVFYVVFHIYFAITTDSFFWYISLACYYGLLILLRMIIILYQKNKHFNKTDKNLEIKKYRFCGFVLTFLPLTLLIPILQIYFLDKAFIREQYLAIGVAAYTFYKITMAIINVIKSKKQQDLTIQAIRNINLADALVSIFSLQTTLLYAFSSQGQNYDYLNILTGSIVSLLSITLGVLMIIKKNNVQ